MQVDLLYQRIAKNVVRTVAGSFPASQFFISKEVVRLQMSEQLKADMNDQRAVLQVRVRHCPRARSEPPPTPTPLTPLSLSHPTPPHLTNTHTHTCARTPSWAGF